MKPKQRSFLKWAGGKYRLVEDIAHRLPDRSCLVEPFVGAGSVFLNTEFERYILADINPDLINLFNVIKQDVNAYISDVKLLFDNSEANTPAFYYKCRKEFNLSDDIFRRATLFLYLNRFGFNGLCRYNKKHQFNVPFGAYSQHYFPEKELRYFAEKAQHAIFICSRFEDIFEYLLDKVEDCVVYCDPPYAPILQESNFTQYAGGGFSLEQQRLLVYYAEQAQNKNIPVLISNHDTAFTREIYKNAEITTFKVQRHIGQNPHSRVRVDELFAFFS
ncbi:Dam family site-specific DNA-(adenine-N6)-methyltransferase [Otariodibacter sp.]|uniref:Dam family site-specific DNA-(adenine-N6)-methyltransferase n=1 Tax=Otariodibacter sp. TaxID=3030919 RepID=UPI00261AAFB8|nr:Dam family site-specific DNA-(adenine-N6)-methyltransferase [Otariodibacter sp.]